MTLEVVVAAAAEQVIVEAVVRQSRSAVGVAVGRELDTDSSVERLYCEGKMRKQLETNQKGISEANSPLRIVISLRILTILLLRLWLSGHILAIGHLWSISSGSSRRRYISGSAGIIPISVS